MATTSDPNKGTLSFGISTATDRVTFQEFEVPPRITLGGSQITALHTFPGGRRVIQNFGNIPQDAIWEGIIMGAGSFDRAKRLKGFSNNGATATLTYGPFTLVGQLTQFTYTPHWDGFIPYQARFVVTQAKSDGPPTTGNAASQDDAAQSALASGTIAAQAAAAAASAQLALLAVAVGSTLASVAQNIVDTIANSPPDQLGALAVTLNGQQATLGAMCAISGPASVALSQSDLQLALALYIQNQLLLAALAGLPAAPGIQVVTVDAPNLFKLAALYYGDAEQASWISACNGNIPFFNPDVTLTLTIQPLPQ
jgi:hypothetical protein